MKTVLQIMSLLILGAVGIMLIYFASIHSQDITKKVLANSTSLKEVIKNQKLIIDKQNRNK